MTTETIDAIAERNLVKFADAWRKLGTTMAQKVTVCHIDNTYGNPRQVYVAWEAATVYQFAAEFASSLLSVWLKDNLCCDSKVLERMTRIIELTVLGRCSEAMDLYNDDSDVFLLMCEYTDAWIEIFEEVEVY